MLHFLPINEPPPGQWLDINEMARRFGVAPVTIRRMVRRGDLLEPHYFAGGMRWSADDYRRWCAERTRARRRN